MASSSSATDSWRTTFAYDSKLRRTEEWGITLHQAIEKKTERIFALRRFELQKGPLRRRHQDHVRDVGKMLDELHEAPHVIAGGPTLWHKDLAVLELHMDWYDNDLCDRLNQTILQRGIIDAKLYVPPFYYDVMTQMADALKFVHKRGIIHRNVISANIMYRNWEDRHFVLSGFSNATRTTPANTRPCGHLSNMSPEMYAEQVQTTAGDMWSLGVVAMEMGVTLPPPDPACYSREGMRQSGWCQTLSHLAKLCPMPELKRLLALNPTKRMTADELCVALPLNRVTTQRPLAVPDKLEHKYVKLQIGSADDSFIDSIMEAPIRVHGKVFARPMASTPVPSNISVDPAQRLIRLNVSMEEAEYFQRSDIGAFALQTLMAGIRHPQIGGPPAPRPNANAQIAEIEEESSAESSPEDVGKTSRRSPSNPSKSAKKSKKSARAKKSKDASRMSGGAASATRETRPAAPEQLRMEPSNSIEAKPSTTTKSSESVTCSPHDSVELEPCDAPRSASSSLKASMTENISSASTNNSELETRHAKQSLRLGSSESANQPENQFETLAKEPLPKTQTEISTSNPPPQLRSKPKIPQSVPTQATSALRSYMTPKSICSSERQGSFSPSARGLSASMSQGIDSNRSRSASSPFQESRRLPQQSKSTDNHAAMPEQGRGQRRDAMGRERAEKPSLRTSPRYTPKADPPDLQSSDFPPLLSASPSEHRDVMGSRQYTASGNLEPTSSRGPTIASAPRAEKVIPNSSGSKGSVRDPLENGSGSSPRNGGSQWDERPLQRNQAPTENGLQIKSEADLGPPTRSTSLPRGQSLEPAISLPAIPESRTHSQSSTTSSQFVRDRLAKLPEPIGNALEVIEDDSECASPKWLAATQLAACYEVNHATILRIAEKIRRSKREVKPEKLRHDAPAWFPSTGFVSAATEPRGQSGSRSGQSSNGSPSHPITRSQPPSSFTGSSPVASPQPHPHPQSLRLPRQRSATPSSTLSSSPRPHVSLRPETRNGTNLADEVESKDSTVGSGPRTTNGQRAQEAPATSKFPPLVLRSSASADLPKIERSIARSSSFLNRQISFKTAVSGQSRSTSSSSVPRQPSSQAARTPSRSRLGDPSRQSSASSGAGIRSRQESETFRDPHRSDSQSALPPSRSDAEVDRRQETTMTKLEQGAQLNDTAGREPDGDDGDGPWLQPKRRGFRAARK